MYVRLTSHEHKAQQSPGGWIQGLTLDATDDEVRAFLAAWRAEEIRELAELN
jgi:hypothetical protein